MAHLQVYTEKRGLIRRRTQYRWRIVARNGRILCHGGEGYNNLADLWHAVSEIIRALGTAQQGSLPIHEGKPKAIAQER